MSHFYDKDGKPCHYQPKKDGSDLRPTTIADARKLKLYPSVSTILACLHKEQLEQKKMEKVILQARDMLRAEGGLISWRTAQVDDAFVNEVKEAAFADWGEAQDLGSRIHAAIELYMGPTGLVPTDEMAPYVYGAVKKLEEIGFKKKEAEVTVVSHQHGYAGTTDLTGYVEGAFAIADFKSTKTKPGKKVDGWPAQAMQLAAYFDAYWGLSSEKPQMVEKMDTDCAYNVYISTTEPGRVEVIKRDADELREAFDAFLNVCEYYFWINKYDPRKNT